MSRKKVVKNNLQIINSKRPIVICLLQKTLLKQKQQGFLFMRGNSTIQADKPCGYIFLFLQDFLEIENDGASRYSFSN